MHVTEIRLEANGGASRATLTRARDAAAVAIEVATPLGTQRFETPAGGDGLWAAAERLQRAMDGYQGTRGDIADYHRALEQLAG